MNLTFLIVQTLFSEIYQFNIIQYSPYVNIYQSFSSFQLYLSKLNDIESNFIFYCNDQYSMCYKTEKDLSWIIQEYHFSVHERPG